MTLLIAFIKALPEIIQLLKFLQAKIEQAETDRKVRDDIKSIHQAFAAGDPEKLKHLFSGN